MQLQLRRGCLDVGGQVPVLNLGDDPGERGLVHGREMASQIRENVETYLRRLEVGGVTPQTAFEEARKWSALIERYNPEYAEEMQGIARGAGLPLEQIALLNARYEIVYSVFSREAKQVARSGGEVEGCTSFAILPEGTKSGHLLMGQNWDWLARLKGRTLVLRVKRSRKPSFVCFTEAGIVGGKMGVNEAGIGLVVNGLVSHDDGKYPYEKPFHVRCREVLDAGTLDKAILPIVQSNRVCSANFMIGHAEGEVIDIEASPDHLSYLYPRDGLLTHANHFLGAERTKSEFERIAPHSLYRGNRLERLLRKKLGELDVSSIREALSDHFSYPNSICSHADPSVPEPKRSITVASIILCLTQRILFVTNGQPCENEYQRVPLAA